MGCKQKLTRVRVDVFETYPKIVQKYCKQKLTQVNTVVINSYLELPGISVNKSLHFADFLIEARV